MHWDTDCFSASTACTGAYSEFYKYLCSQVVKRGAANIKVWVGSGGCGGGRGSSGNRVVVRSTILVVVVLVVVVLVVVTVAAVVVIVALVVVAAVNVLSSL